MILECNSILLYVKGYLKSNIERVCFKKVHMCNHRREVGTSLLWLTRADHVIWPVAARRVED